MEMSIQREGNEEKLTKSEIPERERERERERELEISTCRSARIKKKIDKWA